MVDNFSIEFPELNFSEAVDVITENISPQFEKALNFIFLLSKIVLILAIIYLIVLIISKILKLRDSSNLSVIAKNSSEINSKLGLILENHSKKKKKTEK